MPVFGHVIPNMRTPSAGCFAILAILLLQQTQAQGGRPVQGRPPPPPLVPPLPPGCDICDDSCTWPSDGECDDVPRQTMNDYDYDYDSGRRLQSGQNDYDYDYNSYTYGFGPSFMADCAWGTDCTDCGTR